MAFFEPVSSFMPLPYSSDADVSAASGVEAVSILSNGTLTLHEARRVVDIKAGHFGAGRPGGAAPYPGLDCPPGA